MAFGWLRKRSGEIKNLHARELSSNQLILRFDIILQHHWPIEQCRLHISLKFSLAGKRRVHVLIFDKTNNEHLAETIFQGPRKIALSI